MKNVAATFATVALGACAGTQVRHEAVGEGQAYLHEPADQPVVAVALAEPEHAHQVELRIDLPRAVEVEWKLACPGHVATGVAGEPFEVYRERRLAELREERERRVERAGALTGAIIGAVEAEGGVSAPGASASAEGRIEGRAVGEAAADGAIAEPTLGPHDTGARVVTETIVFQPKERGQCTLALWSAAPDQDVGGVVGAVDVEALIDVKQERRARMRAANEEAIDVRADIYAELVAAGADPEFRARQRAAARARAEREARARAEAQRRRERAAAAEKERRERAAAAEKERRLRVALDVRAGLIQQLVARGADPRARERRERRVARAEAEARRRARAERQRDATLRAEASAEVERERRLRKQAALDARMAVARSLEAAGAVRRPPKPAPPSEARPPRPRADARWIEGRFEWKAGRWQWIAGYWEKPASESSGWGRAILDGEVKLPDIRGKVEGGVEIDVDVSVDVDGSR